MTIIEALKSGKPFRRKGKMNFLPKNGMCHSYNFFPEDILADDWEVKEEKLKLEGEVTWHSGFLEKHKIIRIYPARMTYGDLPNHDFKQFLGKRTRITVEEL